MTDKASHRTASECGHQGCKDDDFERETRAAAADILGDHDLARVCAQESPGVKPDYRSPRHSLEVKRLVSPALQKFYDAYRPLFETPYRPVEELTGYWLVFVDVSDAIESFNGKTTAPRVDSLIESLTPILRDLEKRDVRDAFGDARAWPQLQNLLGTGGHCSVVPEVPGHVQPGIHLAVSYGHSRTTYIANDVVAFLQEWLDSNHSRNARESLAAEDRKRVIALAASIDGPAAAMLRTLSDAPSEAIAPALRLPPEVDALIVITGQEALHFDRDTGWDRHILGE